MAKTAKREQSDRIHFVESGAPPASGGTPGPIIFLMTESEVKEPMMEIHNRVRRASLPVQIIEVDQGDATDRMYDLMQQVNTGAGLVILGLCADSFEKESSAYRMQRLALIYAKHHYIPVGLYASTLNRLAAPHVHDDRELRPLLKFAIVGEESASSNKVPLPLSRKHVIFARDIPKLAGVVCASIRAAALHY